MQIHELEYRIRPRSAGSHGYPVSTQLTINGQDRIFPDGMLILDLDELFNVRSEQQAYNRKLSAAFLKADYIGDALEKGRTAVEVAQEDAVLRVRLLIESDASELQGVRWECLCDSEGRPLFNGDRILFSRYLVSTQLGRGAGKTVRHALIAIANPPHLDQAINPEDPNTGLPPVNVDKEKKLAESGLKGAGFDVTTLAAAPFGKAPATLRNILDELENGYDVFYLVCHGGLVPHDPKDGAQKPMLWLEDGEDPVDASGMVEGIRNMKKQPRLVVLASCQSAGTGGAPSTSASSTLGALGPLLADAGVPAVVAMQGSIQMTTVARFMPEFFSELAKDGQVDRAMGKARGAASDCSDYWMPTLFMRLSDGVIWGPAGPDPDPIPLWSRRGWMAGAGTAALAAVVGGFWWMNKPKPAPTPEQGAKAETGKARQIFADLSAKEAIFPLQSVIDDGAILGEIAPDDPAVWKRLVAIPNEPPFAILRASYGDGRVLVLAHEHILTFQTPEGKNPFLQAALEWLKGKNDARVVVSAKRTDSLMQFPGQAYNLPLLRNEYSSWGYHVETVEDRIDASKLKQAGVVVIPNSWSFEPGEVDAIDAFVKNGGGLMAAGLGWSWHNREPGVSMKNYPMNQLVSRFGASFTSESVGK